MKEGWEYKKLGEVCERITDGSHNPPKGVTCSDNKMLSSQNVRNGYLDLSSLRYLSDEDFQTENKRTNAQQGDVLLTIVGTIGRSCVLTGKEGNITFQRSVAVLKPSEVINSYYLMYCLWSKTELLNKEAQGAAQKGIYLKQLSNVVISYPSLSEQQSIVDYLDSAFAKIDVMKANAEKALNEAKALFQASLKEMLEPKEGWEEKTLKDVSVIYGNYGLSVPSAEYNGVRYLRITDITEWGDLNDEKVSAKLDEEKEQELLKEGDILFARTGATVGKTLMYKEDFGKCLFAGYLIRYRINKEIVLPKFIFYITHSANYYKWVLENQKAAAQPNISAKLYNEYVLSFPSLSEQQSIVATLDSLKSKVDRLQENYDKISQECDVLKQAILRQVFCEE